MLHNACCLRLNVSFTDERSIDDDILNLIDEVDLDEFIKEASDAIEDVDRLTDFVREKSTIAIERFLVCSCTALYCSVYSEEFLTTPLLFEQDWIPKMSIPVERRELGDGWVLTCRGEGGGDLTLSDVIIKRENLCCQVLGGETMFFPMFGHDNSEAESVVSGISSSALYEASDKAVVETSVLDHIRDLLETAQNEGCWVAGRGGVEKVSVLMPCLAIKLSASSSSSNAFTTAAIRSIRRLCDWKYACNGCHQ